jgi:hypothetical protein
MQNSLILNINIDFYLFGQSYFSGSESYTYSGMAQEKRQNLSYIQHAKLII